MDLKAEIDYLGPTENPKGKRAASSLKQMPMLSGEYSTGKGGVKCPQAPSSRQINDKFS